MYSIPGNWRNILEFWQWLEVIGHYKKIPPVYLRENLLATARNLMVNEQSNNNLVPFSFLFLDIERKPEIWNYPIFEPAIYIGNNTLGVKIDTSDINFLEAHLSLDRFV